MKPDALIGLLAALTLVGVGMATRVALWPLATADLPLPAEPATRQAVRSATRPTSDMSAGHARAIVTRDPFRVTRRPTRVAYDPLRAGQPEPPAPPRPSLVLVGIVWDGGADPAAVIEGLPGIEGSRVVRVGEEYGGVRVRRVERALVVLAGLDTVWTLTVREPWQ